MGTMMRMMLNEKMLGYNHHHQNNILKDNNNNLPPGFRFHPTDEELITYYLIKKVLDSNFTARAIAEVDLNKSEPWELPEKARLGEKEWYFFSLRDRKYPTGLRTNRATEAGYWKATGKDREIYSSKTVCLVGMKKTLVFYRGRAPKGEKSNWVMHEYRLEGKFAYHFLSRTSKDEWVISRVFQKTGSGAGGGGCSSTNNNKHQMNMHLEARSASSVVSLPPLLDSPSSSSAATYDISSADSKFNSSQPQQQQQPPHVSCFSTISAYQAAPVAPNFMPDHFSHPPAPVVSGSGGGCVFPTLRSLQENLNFPNFFFQSQPKATTCFQSGTEQDDGTTTCWPLVPDDITNEFMDGTELDCFWRFSY